jgi:hypothetical protein
MENTHSTESSSASKFKSIGIKRKRGDNNDDLCEISRYFKNNRKNKPRHMFLEDDYNNIVVEIDIDADTVDYGEHMMGNSTVDLNVNMEEMELKMKNLAFQYLYDG